jgi:hypothetical protein
MHRNPFARAGVPSHASLSFLDLEHPEISQFDPPLTNERLDQGVERPLHQFLRAKLGEIDLFGDGPDDVFLGHGSGPPNKGNLTEAYDWQALMSTRQPPWPPRDTNLLFSGIGFPTGKLHPIGTIGRNGWQTVVGAA